MKIWKKITISAMTLLSITSLAACSSQKNSNQTQNSKPKTSESTVKKSDSKINLIDWTKKATDLYNKDKSDIDNISKHKEYYKVVTPSITTNQNPNLPESWVSYSELDAQGRAGAVSGLVTQTLVKEHKAQGRPNFASNLIIAGEKNPAQFVSGKWSKLPHSKSNNKEVDIKFGDQSYHGWLYNKSHLFGWSLGGDMEAHNLILGTRGQNVGSNNSKDPGGMSYIETKTRNYVYQNKDAKVLYTAIPVYQNNELLPRAVYVEAIDINNPSQFAMATWTINQQAGVKIDYETGQASNK